MKNHLLNGFGYLVMLMLNGLANGLPLNGKTTKELSDNYPNLFVPAGQTFAIWGLIYLLLLIFVLLPVFQRRNPDVEQVSEKIGYLFFINALANAFWIVAWHYEQLTLSVLIMLLILATLVFINIRVDALLPTIKNLFLKFILQASFGIYLGWICIATIANVTAILIDYSWTGGLLSESVWTCTMILIGTCIAVFLTARFQNPYIGLVVLWALWGIIIARQKAVIAYPDIIYTAVGCMILVLIISILNRKRSL